MHKFLLLAFMIIFASCAAKEAAPPTAEVEKKPAAEQQQATTDLSKLGTVNFPVSCSPNAAVHLTRGLALLHHMTYGLANKEFQTATSLDPQCAIGYWGQAMAGIHPLWSDKPTEKLFNSGKSLLAKAAASTNKSEREADYIIASQQYYTPGWTADEKANLQAFEKGWEAVYNKYPDDLEARSLYALSFLANADPQDKSYARQISTGQLLERVLAEVPDHPGAHHYTIHAFDYPPLAERALDVAYNYGSIAPDIPHALHMPTHIFTRLGLWDDSIEMNKRSAAAALKNPAGGAISLHYLHALDYLAYSYLQKGQDLKAREVRNTIEALKGPIQKHVASSYTLASVSARLAMERHDWQQASEVQAQTPGDYPIGAHPAMFAITHFARALGAANSGQEELAKEEIAILGRLQEQESKSSAYWAKQVEIQQLSAVAWLTYNQGLKEQGLNVMKKAADLEASTDKHPITPGEILPAGELYGDMLAESEKYADALKQYEKALVRSPNRLNSLWGAAHTAELTGDMGKAFWYYTKFVELTKDAEIEMENVNKAKAFLGMIEKKKEEIKEKKNKQNG
ncbi:MAG: hypothetical protein GWO07_08555 [Candidatus Dadabacteria bacterium]|nr:hypothetical protein [Candidatus Dadabacteria bacterium]NIS08797.1 hypothetical protein [Candidatus Dadabacteria bacterium]NIY22147.1 hypothetical protein [Candidatus Dadabacteria bacterium]